MNRRKVTNLFFGIGIALLFISSIWFFILYEIANPTAYKKPDIYEPIQNKTKGLIIDYNFEIKAPAVAIQKVNDETVHATIDVGGIITTVIGGGILLVMTKILNRYWPDKNKG
jgi:hypothetical protein